ncbi:MAG: hypothetical protein ACKO9H_02145, partial [Planctomycetota bacterium]
ELCPRKRSIGVGEQLAAASFLPSKLLNEWSLRETAGNGIKKAAHSAPDLPGKQNAKPGSLTRAGQHQQKPRTHTGAATLRGLLSPAQVR